jgi:hypothetical protein
MAHNPALKILSENWDSGDLGSCIIESAFTLAKVAHAFGNNLPEQIMQIRWGLSVPTMEYVRGVAEEAWRNQGNYDWSPDESPELIDLFIARDNDEVTDEDLTFTARVLERYLRLVESIQGRVG